MIVVLASGGEGGGLNPWLGIGIAIVLILLNALFVAAEFALIAARRTRIEALAEAGDRRARSALISMRNLPLTLSGAQLGITITSLGLGLIAEPAVADVLESVIEPIVDLPSGVLHGISFGVALFLVVFLHMVLGEMVPKNLALAGAERTLLWIAVPHLVFVIILRPLIWALNALAALILRVFGIEQVEELGTAHTAQEFVTMIDASKGEGLIDEFSHTLLSGALDFRDRDCESLMIPWNDVVTVERQATVEEMAALATSSGHTRLPIVNGTTVLGFVHAKDLVYVEAAGQQDPIKRDLIRRMLVVPTDRALEALLFAMRRSQIHMAVIQRDGVPAGIVTLEDILESIVGDIIDETDRIRGFERVR